MISIAPKLLVFLLAAGLCLAQTAEEPHAGPQNPFRNDPTAAAAGGEVFRIHCAACHGAKGEGGSGPDLSEGAYGVGDRDEDLFQIVSRGRDVMRGFRNILDEESIWRVITFVRSLAGRNLGTVQGDVAAGENLFWNKGGCGQCHRVGLNGSSAGPDLTEIGIRRGAAHLRESLLQPDADVPRGYAMASIKTQDGKNMQGILRRSDSFSVQMFDLQGNFYSFLREELQQITESKRSLMPAYEGTFSETELKNLIAYLSRLGRETKQ